MGREIPTDIPGVSLKSRDRDLGLDIDMHIMTVEHGKVGHIILTPWPRRAAEIRYDVDEAFRRRGFATAAIKTVTAEITRSKRFDRIVAKINPDNESSIKAVLRAGFVRIEDPDYAMFEYKV